MIEKVTESINFLIAEYNRLKAKQKNNTITREEKEALQKLIYFIKKNDQ